MKRIHWKRLRVEFQAEEPIQGTLQSDYRWIISFSKPFLEVAGQYYERAFRPYGGDGDRDVIGWKTDWLSAARHVLIGLLAEDVFWPAGTVPKSSKMLGERGGLLLARWMQGMLFGTGELDGEIQVERQRELWTILHEYNERIWEEGNRVRKSRGRQYFRRTPLFDMTEEDLLAVGV